jgi:hypothetical protein
MGSCVSNMLCPMLYSMVNTGYQKASVINGTLRFEMLGTIEREKETCHNDKEGVTEDLRWLKWLIEVVYPHLKIWLIGSNIKLYVFYGEGQG